MGLGEGAEVKEDGYGNDYAAVKRAVSELDEPASTIEHNSKLLSLRVEDIMHRHPHSVMVVSEYICTDDYVTSLDHSISNLQQVRRTIMGIKARLVAPPPEKDK